MTAVRHASAISLEGASVVNFAEKPQLGEGWMHGGFFVVEHKAALRRGDDVIWEREPIERLARDGEADGVSARWLLALHGHPA